MVRCSTLLHLPPLIFHCVGGCSDCINTVKMLFDIPVPSRDVTSQTLPLGGNNLYTAKTKYRNFETNLPRKGILGRVSVPISTFMRLWVIHIFPRSVCLFCWRKYVDRSWDYINRSQTHELGIGADAALFPEKEYISGIFVAVYMTSLFPPRESLVSDIPAGDRNIKHFFTVIGSIICLFYWPVVGKRSVDSDRRQKTQKGIQLRRRI